MRVRIPFASVGVIYGGASSEREISVRSGRAVAEALRRSNLNIEEIDSHGEFARELAGRSFDAVFIVLHGRGGEDGEVQEVLEALHVPYTGSGPGPSRLAFHKDLSKGVFKRGHIPTPCYAVCRPGGAAIGMEVRGPWVVKPTAEGSSIGVNLVDDFESLQRMVRMRCAEGETLLVEERIIGRELTVGIVGDEALPVIELKTSRPFYDYTAKYTPGFTQYLLPADLSGTLTRTVQALALDVFRALELRGFARVDLMLDAQERPYVLEANSIPGFTSSSLLPKAAAYAGRNFDALCLEILARARLEEKPAHRTNPLTASKR